MGTTLYELDGLQEGPLPLAEGLEGEVLARCRALACWGVLCLQHPSLACWQAAWLEAVVPHIQERMQRYASTEVRAALCRSSSAMGRHRA